MLSSGQALPTGAQGHPKATIIPISRGIWCACPSGGRRAVALPPSPAPAGTILLPGIDGSTQRVPRPPVNTPSPSSSEPRAPLCSPRAPSGPFPIPALLQGHPNSSSSLFLPTFRTSPRPHVPQAPSPGLSPTSNPKSSHHGTSLSLPQLIQVQDGGHPVTPSPTRAPTAQGGHDGQGVSSP